MRLSSLGEGRVPVQARPFDRSVGALVFTETQTLDCPDLTQAIDGLNKERQRLGVVTACQKNPPLWDGIGDDDDPTTLEEKTAQVDAAIAACKLCPVLDQCEDVLWASWESSSPGVPSGVMAGYWSDDTVEGGYILQYLDTGELPEEALKMTREMP